MKEFDMLKKSFASVAAVAVALGTCVAAGTIVIPTTPIGNPGNAPDHYSVGAVAYTYNIGVYEVTNAQYTVFLNAVAAADTFHLYNTNMAGVWGGIVRQGTNGSYTYSTVSGRENNPVNYVSVWDAFRFANWLHNGQPTGSQKPTTTEDGAYTLTPDGMSTNTTARNAGWRWALPSANEWHKAAYHQPASEGGNPHNYWFYPTSSNTITTAQANYGSHIGNLVPIGSYAANYYGVFDMGGNVQEWTESITVGPYRGVHGGSFVSPAANLQSFARAYSNLPTLEAPDFGFRVVQVPGPASWALMALGGAVALRRRRGAGRV